ncbi:PREDICTED: probable E3 ubiquitin-protein ligase TRIML1 [Nanorana parkeri]|uniref:probable E3 ubiquitin-protein ligase TRIML1 n=1 Tax=Nanorana parkeri TaxID=125878 RepID=UPI000854A178|nr:PREDICTED: probable E3 ubiquitin-protein ligase TRIML1 [Nanorana parkeri]
MASGGSVRELQDGSLCPLCSCYFKDPVTTECGHSYCRVCLVTYAGGKENMGQLMCPSCRRVMAWRVVTTDVRLGVTTRIAQRLNIQALPPRRKKMGREIQDNV